MKTIAAATALVVSMMLFCFSLLAVFRAPTYLTWQLSVLATEAGHFIALLALLPIAAWRLSRTGKVAAVLGGVAFVLLMSPTIRALRIPGGVDFGTLYFGGQTQVPFTRHEYAAADGTQLTLDLYTPSDTGHAAPLIIMIHGGSWQGGTSQDLAPLNWRLAEGGYAVAAITYRFAPAHLFPDQLTDVRAAIAFLKGNGGTFGIDTTRIVLIGRSAGGHLATLAALTANDRAVRGAVSLYGVHDLAWGYEHPAAPRVHDSRRILREFLGGTPETVPDAYREASPVTHAATSPPLLLVHGSRDELVNVRHARRLSDALRAAGRPHTYIELPWATHGCDYIFRGPCGQVSTRAIEQFLAGIIGRPSGQSAAQRL